MTKISEFSRYAGLTFVVLLFAGSGVLHFVATDAFQSIVPPGLPLRREAVYVSGACEILGALGLCLPRLRAAAGIGLILLTIAVTPANVYMYDHAELFPTAHPALLFWRLPLQLVLLALIWAVAVRRPE
jgi:uncharacterized membrane protein